MSLEKSPAFQFYASDFLVDENVNLMSNREIGCYIKLLCFCWREKTIPADVKKIARLCGESEDEMAELWAPLEPCFKSDNNGRLVQPRLEAERKKQEEWRRKSSLGGKESARVRSAKRKAAFKGGSTTVATKG